MGLKRVLGEMLLSRMAGRGGARGGVSSAALLGSLGGDRRGGLGVKAGLAGLAYIAYQAYQARQARAPESAFGGRDPASDGLIGGIIGNLASGGVGGAKDGDISPIQKRPVQEDELADRR